MLLEKEIDLIKLPKVREAVRECITERIEVLRDLPASISGRYHPPEERGPGGMAIHLARLCRIIEDLWVHLGLTVGEHDLLITAALLHDISNVDLSSRTQYGTIVRDHKVYSQHHAEMSFAVAAEYFLKQEYELKDPFMLDLQGIIGSHMGVWMKDSKKPTRKLEIIFSLLDFIDTRSYVHIDLEGIKYV